MVLDFNLADRVEHLVDQCEAVQNYNYLFRVVPRVDQLDEQIRNY